MGQTKVTFKTIPYYPDLVIREAVCNINQTWEDFLKGFGVDLTKTAPGVNFFVRSRKGTSTLFDKIEFIASKYIQRHRILVAIEKDLGRIRIRRTRKRRRYSHCLPNFETRVEKIEDFNVIRKSSVIWQDPIRCFSMSDNDFIL